MVNWLGRNHLKNTHSEARKFGVLYTLEATWRPNYLNSESTGQVSADQGLYLIFSPQVSPKTCI